MTKVLVVGQTPPPYGGQAIMIERFVRCKMADVELIHVRMGFSSNMNEVGRVRIAKILHMFGLILRIIYRRFASGVRILYYPPSGPDRVSMYRDVIILIATRWLFDKTIFHYHASGLSELYGELSPVSQWFFRRAYFGADAAIRLSHLTPEDGRLLEAKQDYIIPYHIDDPCPNFTPLPHVESYTKDRPLRILLVGILRESKGVLVLVEACAKLLAKGIPIQVEVMGQWYSNEFKALLTKRIDELKLGNYVRFLGVVTGPDKFVHYRNADVFCFPSFFNCEAFPVVVLEAMGCGLPVVSTRWRGIPTMVDEGETGFLVEPHDASAVAERLTALAYDASLRESMGLAGRSKFERNYSIARHASRMRHMLLETAGIKPAIEAEPAGKAVAAA